MSHLNLVVLRSSDVAATRRFYECLDRRFELHSHGGGPEHFASDHDGLVLEIYPRGEGHDATGLGFEVTNFEAARAQLLAAGFEPGEVSHQAWGATFVVRDPDGRRVEVQLATGLQRSLAVAGAFGDLLERDDIGGLDFVTQLEPILATLLAESLRLPDVEPTSADLDVWRPSDDECRSRYRSLRERLGPRENYWTTMDASAPLDDSSEPVDLPMTDDLVDIWRDVTTARRAHAGRAATADVIWELRFSCRTHWGLHAAEALRALRSLGV